MPSTTPPSDLQNKVLDVLQTIRDPEIPVNIVELGLIYELTVNDAGDVYVRMTLTTPNCPVAGDLLKEVESKVAAVDGVSNSKVDLVWEPVWTKDRMSDAAKLALDMMGGDLPGQSKKDKFFKLGRIK
ncbi:MAG: DUF59 domain-containing protein [Phycisphaerales bacterium]|nr:DUF59 domain-containing protein [Phycisphaerales bacterium]MCB9864595.1 DUF59 domain-containing protein [Phycisphaerales bacterium]